MTGFFVSAIGTDVGKTFVTAGLVRALGRRGRIVEALKPVASGWDPALLAATDTGILLAAMGRPVTEAEAARISPWRFSAPLSPDMAARREGRSIDFDRLIAFSRERITRRDDALLIEGVGGIMVPLDERHTVLDWMGALDLPVLLVAGSYLGAISHTLTALEVLRGRSLPVAALIVSETLGSTVDLDETVATIRRFSAQVEIITLPRLVDAGQPAPAFDTLAGLF
jgi:dethiobiotin synthetase